MNHPSTRKSRERGELIHTLRELLTSSLALSLAPDEIDPDAPLFGAGIGLDSVDAVEVVVQLERRFGLTLAGTENTQTVLRSLNVIADAIDAHRATSTSAAGAEASVPDPTGAAS